MGPVVRAHCDVFSHLDFVAHLPQAVKKLPLRHRLADGSVYIGFDEGEIGGAALLLGPPFPVVFGFSPLRVFNDRKPILPAQSVGFPLHVEVILFRAVVFDPIEKRNCVHHKMVVQVVGFV